MWDILWSLSGSGGAKSPQGRGHCCLTLEVHIMVEIQKRDSSFRKYSISYHNRPKVGLICKALWLSVTFPSSKTNVCSNCYSLDSKQCSMEENCLAPEAYRLRRESPNFSMESRRLLRFTTNIENIGDADFRPFIPKTAWEWHACHMHYHSMEVCFTVSFWSYKKVIEKST